MIPQAPSGPRLVVQRQMSKAPSLPLANASPELIEKRRAICRACEMYRDKDTKVPANAPFCAMKCGAYLEYKWANDAIHCCQKKW